MIRQNAARSAAVLIRTLRVLTVVANVERRHERRDVLHRHTNSVLGDGKRDIPTPADLDDLRGRHRRIVAILAIGPISMMDSETI